MPAPPPAGSSYFLTGHANQGVGSSQTQIAFFDSPQAVNPYPLVVVDPAAPSAAPPQFEAEATTLDIANASEWYTSGGNATSWGVRYRLYARHNTTSGADNLYAIDLRKASASAAVPTAGTQMSTVIVAGNGSQPALCWFDRAFFDNFYSADQSWVVFHAKGPDANCGTADDQFVAVEPLMGPAAAPILLAQLQPVDAMYDATGKLTGFLAIAHPPVNASVQPNTPVPLQQLGTDFSVAKTFGTKLTGNGVTGNSGDFVSLGVSPLGVWLYRDTSDIWAVDIAGGVQTKVFSIGVPPGNPGDTIAAGTRAVFDGTSGYVAVSNATSGSYVLQINLSSKAYTQQPVDATATAGIRLVGTTSTNLVYVYSDGRAIKSVSKNSVAAAGTSLYTAAANQSVEGPLGSPNGTPPVFLVQDQIYFTVSDSGTGAHYAYTGSGNSGTATPLGAGSDGAVLGTIAATFPAAGPVISSGALVVTGGVHTAKGFANAALSNYGSNGALAVPIGTLPNVPLGISQLAVATGPMQAGMPALLEMSGVNNGVFPPTVDDVGLYDPGAATSFQRITPYMQ